MTPFWIFWSNMFLFLKLSDSFCTFLLFLSCIPLHLFLIIKMIDLDFAQTLVISLQNVRKDTSVARLPHVSENWSKFGDFDWSDRGSWGKDENLIEIQRMKIPDKIYRNKIYLFVTLCLYVLLAIFQVNLGWPILVKLRMMEVELTTGTIRCAKLQTNCHHQETNTQCFTGWMPFLSTTQQCRSTEGKISHSTALLAPSTPDGFPALTTKGSWLPWVRAAMPFISPLMQIPMFMTTVLFC